MNLILDKFFSKSFENSLNSKLLNYDFIFPVLQVKEYVVELCSVSIKDFLSYIENFSKVSSLSSKDIFQFSNFDDATRNLCKLVKQKEDPGLKHVAIGKILLDDGKKRNDGAYIKYGENHAKFAEDLGLMYSLESVFFLSCLGHVLDELEEDLYIKLLTRLVLRLRLVQKLYLDSLKGIVDLRDCLSVLSESTYIRRSSNVKTVLKFLINSEEYDFRDFVGKIKMK